MSKRKSSLILQDILNAIDHIGLFTRGLAFKDFAGNFMIIEACLYNIQVIGEAVSQLPENIKDNRPAIPWSLIKGMRNRLIHEYFGTDLPVVWNVIANELPALKADFNSIYQDLLVRNE